MQKRYAANRLNAAIILSLFVALSSCKKQTPSTPTQSNIELPSVDKAVADFMTKYSLPGVSIALVKDDRLVYAKSYGVADKASNTPLRTDHVFRLASVSKSITSVAAFKLIEDGKLSLDAKVFGQTGLLGTEYGTKPYGKDIEAITVRHLLQHTAGGWNNQQNDPMFVTAWAGYTQSQLISTVLNTRPLATTPGTKFEYSNFGYLVLGRVIERASGQPYRDYVRDAILKPAGITSMDVAGDIQADRFPNEVTYYDAGYSPYGMKIKRMDAHGGWAASAPDLARLLVRVNGFSGKSDLLTPSSLTQMTTAPSNSSGYACGWSVNSANNWWHTGSLPGTSTMWARTSSGLGWVILVNQRSSAASFSSDLDGLMWKGTQGITQWPTQDLF